MTTVTRAQAATLIDHYVLVIIGDAVIAGRLTAVNNVALTLIFSNSVGVATGTEVIDYADITDLADFYADDAHADA